MRGHAATAGQPRPGGAGFETATVTARLPALLAAGAGLVALYALMSWALRLPKFFPGPGVTLGFPQMLGPGWQEVTVQYTVAVVVAFLLYGIALAAVWRAPAPALVLYGFPVLFIAVLLYMYPPTAVDMFHYHADARTFWVYGDNPLLVAPDAHPYPVGMSWGEMPSPYGPFWSLLTFGPALLPGEDYLLGLLLFKALAGLFYLGSALLVARIVSRLRPGWEATAIVLFAWNPFVALRVLGNGHNDIAMLFFVLLSLERAQRGDWLSALPVMALSVLIKFVSALLVPMLLWYAWTHTPGDVRARLRALAPGVGAALLATVLCFAPFWAGARTFDTIRAQADNNKLMITSTPLLVRDRLAADLGEEDASVAAKQITRLIFLALYLPLLWQSGGQRPTGIRQRTEDGAGASAGERGAMAGNGQDFARLLSCGFNALFLYLIIAIPWFRPWYMLWPVTLAALLPGTWFTPLLLVTSFSHSFPDIVEQYRGHIGWLAQNYWRLVSAPVVTAFAPALGVWAVGLLGYRTWHFDASRPPDEDERGRALARPYADDAAPAH